MTGSHPEELALNEAVFHRLVQIAERIPFVCELQIRQELTDEFNMLADSGLAEQDLVSFSLAEGPETIVRELVQKPKPN